MPIVLHWLLNCWPLLKDAVAPAEDIVVVELEVDCVVDDGVVELDVEVDELLELEVAELDVDELVDELELELDVDVLVGSEVVELEVEVLVGSEVVELEVEVLVGSEVVELRHLCFPLQIELGNEKGHCGDYNHARHSETGLGGMAYLDDRRRSVSYPLCRHIVCKLGAVAFFVAILV